MERRRAEESVAVAAVRDAPAEGIEVLLSETDPRRYSFPKSRILDVDATLRMAAHCHGVTEATATKHLDPRKAPLRCLGHWVAASRELFIRTGVLFCSTADSVAPVPPETRARLVEQRPRLEQRPADFMALLEKENLSCDLSRVVPFARWLDSRDGGSPGLRHLFLSELSGECEVASDQALDGTSQWFAPATIMVQYQRAQIFLDFETFACLRVLADFRNTRDLFLEYGLAESQPGL